MSSSVDDRIVAMKFDNASFERGAKTTIGTLDKLKESLNFSGAVKGLDDIQNTSSRFNLSGMEAGVAGLSKSFIGLTTVAVTALATITSKAVDAGLTLAKSLTIAPIKQGFDEYETNLNSIQTVLANTASQGTKLKDVNKALDELNTYSDKTIYNFSEMARNIGTFTAAGVDLKTSVSSIKGIANLAAISGSTSEQASTAMYQLSQAISTGKVQLQDWNSVVNAGMGGKTFQDALYRTGKAMGAVITQGSGKNKVSMNIDQWVKSGNSFRDSLQSGWVTSEVLTQTLEGFTGDLSDAQLKAMGYTKAQIAEIQKLGKTGQDAATKVKTLSQLIGTLQEAVGSGWAKTWQILFGNFDEAKKTFTSVSDVLGGMIQASADARNAMLGDWKKLGGRKVLIEAISNAFNALMSVIKPIREAFRDIFPRTTGQQLYNLTVTLRNFTERLTLSGATADKLKRVFKGVFAVFSIIKQVIVGVAKGFSHLFGAFNSGNSDLLNMAAGVGDFLVGLDEMLKKGGKLTNFFDKLGQVIAVPIKFIKHFQTAMLSLVTGGASPFLDDLSEKFSWLGPIIEDVRNKIQDIISSVKEGAGKLGDLFNFGDKAEGAAEGVSAVQGSLQTVPSLLDRIKAAWTSVADAFSKIGDFLTPVWEKIKEVFSSLKDKVVNFISGLGLEEGLALINTGFFIAVYMALKKFIGSFGGLIDSYSGMFTSIGKSLDQVTSNLKTMQTSIRAEIIQKIAIALLALAAALWIISKLDSGQLKQGLIAVGILLAELVAALAALEKTTSTMGAAKLSLLSLALLALGVGLVGMAAAVKVFGSMDPEALSQGLKSVGIVLAGLVTATVLLNASGGATSILAAATALAILSAALLAFAGAVKLYSMMDLSTLADGGLKIAATLTVIGLSLRTFPKGILKSAAALFIIASALVVISGAMKAFGSMKPEEVSQAIKLLASSLLIISVALRAMTGTVSGAAAILVFAIALNALVPPLMLLGKMDVAEIGKALLFLGGFFFVLGAAALILGPVVPIILLLAASITLLGVGALAAGVGVFAFATGLALLAVSGAAGIAILVAAVIGIAELIPLVMQQIGLGILAFAKVISEGGPVLVEAFTTVLESMLQAVIDIAPKIRETFGVLLDNFLKVIIDSIPKIVRAALTLMARILQAIADNIPKIAHAGANIIIAFLDAMKEEIPRVVDAGFDMIIDLLDGISDAIDKNAEEMGRAGGRLATAIIKGMVKGIAGGASEIKDAAKEMAGNALKSAKSFLGINSPSKAFEEIGKNVNQGFAQGIDGYSNIVSTSVESMGAVAVDTMKTTLDHMYALASGSVDMTPVITPVLDLTQVQAQGKKMSTMLGTGTLTPTVSSQQASTISASTTATDSASVPETVQDKTPTVVFEQHNYSPKALDPIEIYRNTRNQISLAKEALNK